MSTDHPTTADHQPLVGEEEERHPFVERYGESPIAGVIRELQILRAQNNRDLKAQLGVSNQRHAQLSQAAEAEIIEQRMKLHVLEEIMAQPPLYGDQVRVEYEKICNELDLVTANKRSS